MTHFTVKNGTPKGKPLCDTCRWCAHIHGFSLSAELIRCNFFSRDIPFSVYECNQYTALGSLSLSEMDSIAWILVKDKQSGRIGFKSATDLMRSGEFTATPPHQSEGIMKFRKLPVEVEAVQWTGENYSELLEFCGEVVDLSHLDPVIETREGEMFARRGDWIIKGVNGEFYPCKPDIFVKTYERLDQ